MGKFNISKPDAPSVIDEATLDLPVNNQEVSQNEASPENDMFAELAASVDQEAIVAGVEAGAGAELDIQEQQERERVPDIISRKNAPDEAYNYNNELAVAAAKRANEGLSADGGLSERSKLMGQKLASNDKDVIKISGVSPDGTNPVAQVLQTTNAFDADGKIDSQFGQMVSVITEDAMMKLSFNEPIEGDIRPAEDEAGQKINYEASKARPVSKIQGNKELGQQIHRDWQRYKNAQQGVPTDQYTDLPSEQAVLLGDAAKELYHRTNGPDFIKRYQTADGLVNFELTPNAITQLSKGDYKRKKMFPKQHARPSKTPLTKGKQIAEGRTYTKGASSKTGKVEGDKVLQESMRNLGTVPNVVDPQRLKILLATSLPVLSGEVDPTSPFGMINHVGQDKIDAFKVKADADPNYNFDEEYNEMINGLAQDVYNIVKEKDGANYLTYYVQAYNGRIAPQQIGFDPTSSKSTRFVTRNAVPAKVTPGSRIERNLRQMYAMMLVNNADGALPNEREALLKRDEGKLLRWGTMLKSEINKISDADVEAAAAAIKEGIPVTDPKFPKLRVPEITDPELLAAINKKGEDGQAYIDGLIDFSDYYNNVQIKKKPHFSYFNAYMDGKTNGLAANGMQMGSENVAYKTGVLRSQGKRLLDNDVDIRKDLSNVLLEGIRNDGFAGVEEKFNNEIAGIARKIFDYGNAPAKAMLKGTTMTFGYGMELESFKKNINEAIDLTAQADPDFKASLHVATNQGDPNARKDMVAAIHSNFVEGLQNALDPDALQSREMMRSAAFLHSITDELFTIKSPIGLDLNFGAQVAGEAESVGEYKVYDQGERKSVTAYQQTSTASSSAIKRRADDAGNITETPGDVAYGGAVPGAVQSTDAATVAETTTGRSWNRLKHASNGNPYIHTIYDAFKVDAMGYDVVLDEVNKNWIDINFRWNYLEETRDAVKELNKKFNEKMAGRPDNSPVTDKEFAVAKHYLAMELSAKGNLYMKNMLNRLPKFNSGFAGEENNGKMFAAINNIEKQMGKVGYNVRKPPAQPTVLQLKTFVKLMAGTLDLSGRLNPMIHKVNGKKSALKAKIKNDGAKVYQYYSH